MWVLLCHWQILTSATITVSASCVQDVYSHHKVDYEYVWPAVTSLWIKYQKACLALKMSCVYLYPWVCWVSWMLHSDAWAAIPNPAPSAPVWKPTATKWLTEVVIVTGAASWSLLRFEVCGGEGSGGCVGVDSDQFQAFIPYALSLNHTPPAPTSLHPPCSP